MTFHGRTSIHLSPKLILYIYINTERKKRKSFDAAANHGSDISTTTKTTGRSHLQTDRADPSPDQLSYSSILFSSFRVSLAFIAESFSNCAQPIKQTNKNKKKHNSKTLILLPDSVLCFALFYFFFEKNSKYTHTYIYIYQHTRQRIGSVSIRF